MIHNRLQQSLKRIIITRVLALADQSKIGCITQPRFAKAGTETPPQRGAALDRNGLSVSTETACRFEPKSPAGNSEICTAQEAASFLREYDKIAQQCAAEGLDHPRYLLRLAELELIERERRMIERRIKEARFPTVKSLDSFDFTAIPSLNKTLVLELARCEYIARRENVIAVGNSGTGKSHIALGLGLA